MIMEISPYRELGVGSSCFDDCFISVFKGWGKEYEFFTTDSYNFNYKSSDSPYFGDRIHCNRKYNYDVLLSHHGIKTCFIEETDSVRASKLIIEAVSLGCPVCINIDDFGLHWSPNYQTKYGPNHYCLITGYLPNEDSFRCIDPIYVTNENFLSVKDFIINYQGKLNIIENFSSSRSEDYPTAFNNCVKTIIRSNNISDMKLMTEQIRQDLDFEKEKTDIKNFYEIPLFRSFENVAFGRKSLHDTVLLLCKYFTDYKPLAEKTLEVMNYWAFLKGLVAKEFLKNNAASSSLLPNVLYKRLQTMIQLEENLMGLLYEYTLNQCGYDPLKQTTIISNHSKIQSYDSLDLSHYFNNQGIGLCNDADFTGTGEYIVSDHKFSYEVWVYEDDFHFIMQNNVKEKDNISCMGQSIDIEPQNYSSIKIIGCAVCGNSVDKVSIRYEDYTEDLPLNFSDWSSSQPLFGEEVIWEGKNSLESTVYLFVQTLQLDRNNKLKGLVLPNNSNVHIFSMILCL